MRVLDDQISFVRIIDSTTNSVVSMELATTDDGGRTYEATWMGTDVPDDDLREDDGPRGDPGPDHQLAHTDRANLVK